MKYVGHLTQDRLYALKVYKCISSRLSVFSDIVEKCSYFFTDPDFSSPEAQNYKKKIWNEQSDAELSKIKVRVFFFQ